MRTFIHARTLTVVSSTLLAVGGLIAVPASAATTQPTWAAEQLSVLTNVTARDINNNVVVIGSQQTGTGTRSGVEWVNGAMSVLPSLTGATASDPLAINDSGTIVGRSVIPTSPTPVVTVWSGTTVAQTSPPVQTYGSAPLDVNESGQIVGGWLLSATAQPRAFLLSQGQFTDLGTVGGAAAEATSINDSGMIAGTVTYASTATPRSAVFVRFADGTSHVIGLPPGYVSATAVRVNNLGQVLFTATTGAQGQRASFVWQSYRTAPLTVAGCGPSVNAADINASGQVVGTCVTTTGQTRAFIWTGGTSAFLPVPSGVTQTTAKAVNDKGDVLGSANFIPTAALLPVVWHWSGPSWGDVYTWPGYRVVKGREWSTTCEAYSSTATRCTAKIWATVVKKTIWWPVAVTDWAFNNLTYTDKASAAWSTNPLAVTGTFASAGRLWSTTCTPSVTSGPRTCRTYIWATVYGRTALPTGGYTYWQKNQWVFNNMVILS